MPPQEPPDRLNVVLQAHRDKIIAEHARRLQAEVPVFTSLPPVEIRRRSSLVVDWVLTSLSERNVSILAQHLDAGIRRWMHEGFLIEAQIAASQILEEIITGVATPGLADDPATLASALRRVHSLGVMSRNVMSRINLSETVKKPPA
ncbi:MAG TPA: hypothetical protein VKY74_26575 [Chloroflexia bacterium]|nr:hypothetical protein [Chloroflexia bacterium]